MRWTFDAARGVVIDEHGRARACVTDEHVVIGNEEGEAAAQDTAAASSECATTIIVWSGTMADGGDAERFTADPRNWSASAWAKLREGLVHALGVYPHVWVRTHAAHVVSDIPSCVRFLGTARELRQGVSLLIDPLSMLTLTMAASPTAVDHLTRLCDWLAQQTSGDIAGVVVAQSNEPDSRRGELSRTLERLLGEREIAFVRVEL